MRTTILLLTIIAYGSMFAQNEPKQATSIFIGHSSGVALTISKDGRATVDYGATFSIWTPRYTFPPAEVEKMLKPYLITHKEYTSTIQAKWAALYDQRKITHDQYKAEVAKTAGIGITYNDGTKEHYRFPKLEPIQKFFLQVLDNMAIEGNRKASLHSWMFRYPPFGLEQVVIKEPSEELRKAYQLDNDRLYLEEEISGAEWYAKILAKDKASLSEGEKETINFHEERDRFSSNIRAEYDALKSKTNLTAEDKEFMNFYEFYLEVEKKSAERIKNYKNRISKTSKVAIPVATANSSQPKPRTAESSTPWFIFATIGTCLAVFIGFLYKGWKLSSARTKK